MVPPTKSINSRFAPCAVISGDAIPSNPVAKALGIALGAPVKSLSEWN